MDRAIRNMILQINAGDPFQGVLPFQRRAFLKRDIEISSS